MTSADEKPPVFNYILSFILVGLAWGFTTPFIRRAAQSHNPPAHPVLESPSVQASWLKSKLYGAFFAVIDLLKNPRYAIPLVLNLTGSIWFFLLIGQAAFLFTVLGDWYVDGKVISKDTAAGMALMLLNPNQVYIHEIHPSD
ncbi:integral membrane protein [Fusarium beomiforme]|uniref:Integral membrane protein n=1 Tax=Fusarium beomiforme TaxID=44412 RepID=A0A9P5ABD8_9HYPO|nr:integral membrane protein [Fusarium beomiforme]